MFGLPATTALMVFGIPLLWIIYTAVFLYRTRDWSDDDQREEGS